MLRLILTCEHGGNHIPAAYTNLFDDKLELLQSHRGYDPGALELLESLAGVADKSFKATTSRLLIEFNRSINHKDLFSEVTKPLPDADKKKIIQHIYKPYRDQVEGIVHDFVMADRRVLHVAVHTFTPELDGVEREADIGLLYDPKRKPEAEFARKWKKMLLEQDESLLVRFNYPYLGISDGFPTYLRRKFKDEQYLGIEIEVNQKFVLENQQRWEQLQQIIRTTLQQLVHPHRGYGVNEEAA